MVGAGFGRSCGRVTTRVAVIGLGYFSQFHLAAWQALPGAELCAVTDLDPARREWAKHCFAAPVAKDIDALLAREPDIIDIVAPPTAHAALIRASLARGRVIICQKPVCTSLQEASEIAQEASAAGATLIVHENFRFQPWYRTVKAALDAGEIGSVYSARFALRPGDGQGARAYLDRQPAFQSMERFLIHETGVHFIDLFRWFLGEITAVYADLRRLNPVIAGEDAGQLLLDHGSRVQSLFDGNRLADHKTDAPRRTMGELGIEGAAGTLTLLGDGVVRLRRFGDQNEQILPPAFPPDPNSFGGGCVHALCAHVLEAVTGQGDFENQLNDYLPVIRLVDLAYVSAADHRKVFVTQS